MRAARCVASPHPAGHTLLEIMLSLVLLSVVMASVSSAVMFASQAVPDEDSAVGSLLADSAVLGRIAEDLASAQYIIEQADHAITIVVPDRTGDSIPDRIRYAWSGKQGEPLFFQLNDDNAVTVIDAVYEFELSYTQQSATEAMPAAIYLGSESLIASSDSSTSGGQVTIEPTQWSGQAISPALASDALGYVPTRVDIHAGWRNPSDGKTLFAIRDLSESTPGSNTYASSLFDESTLSGSNSWESLSLADGTTVPADQSTALTATYQSGTTAVLELSTSTDDDGLLATSDSGTTWAEVDDKSLAYRLYGQQVLTSNTSYAITRQHLTAIDVSLQRVADERSPLQRRVRTMTAPPILTGYANSGLSVDPVGMDLNADGAADWSHSGGAPSTDSITDGIWTSDGELIYDHSSLGSAAVIRVRARMRSSDTLGPTIYGPFTFNSSNELLPVITLLRDDGAGGQELVVYNDTSMSSQHVVFTGLPAGFVDIELTLIPAHDLVSFKVNHQNAGAVVLERIADPGAIEPSVSFGSRGIAAEFRSIDVAVGGSAAASSSGDAVEIDLEEIGISLF